MGLSKAGPLLAWCAHGRHAVTQLHQSQPALPLTNMADMDVDAAPPAAAADKAAASTGFELPWVSAVAAASAAQAQPGDGHGDVLARVQAPNGCCQQGSDATAALP